MMRLGVFSRGQTVKGLFNHVKRLGLYPTGSQDSGKGLKPLKHHHLSDRQGRVLTGNEKGELERLESKFTGWGKPVTLDAF